MKTVKRSALKAFSKATKIAAADVELSTEVAVLDGIFSLKEQLTAHEICGKQSNAGSNYHYKNKLLCMRLVSVMRQWASWKNICNFILNPS